MKLIWGLIKFVLTIAISSLIAGWLVYVKPQPISLSCSQTYMAANGTFTVECPNNTAIEYLYTLKSKAMDL